jgi:YebC/PmpR family DNA-binding regulatory protein
MLPAWRDAGQVALHVGHEHRHAELAEVLGQGLQRDGLAGAGGAGDQAVAVGQGGQQLAAGCRRAGRKGRQDEKRGKVWTRVIREIMVAARQGGGDVSANPRLRLAIDKAKAANMPADTVKRNIDKATGNLEGVSYEEIRYEGYGIGGAAIIVDTMTDNRVRTVAEVRHAFSKYGGNLGTEGSVAFQFKHCGQLVFEPGTSEDKVMEVALEAGAEDVVTGDDGASRC